MDMAKQSRGFTEVPKQYRNQWKNGYLFLRALAFNSDFRNALGNLTREWPVPATNQELGWWFSCQTYGEVKKKNKIAFSQREAFLRELEEKSLAAFSGEVSSVLHWGDFGEEWRTTITDYAISNWISPPIYNLHVERATHHGRLSIVLNHDTTIEDLKEAWWWISKQRKEMNSNDLATSKHFTVKSLPNFLIAIQDLAIRLDDPHREKADLDIVGKIWEKVEDTHLREDKKRATKLRQLRRRFREQKL